MMPNLTSQYSLLHLDIYYIKIQHLDNNFDNFVNEIILYSTPCQSISFRNHIWTHIRLNIRRWILYAIHLDGFRMMSCVFDVHAMLMVSISTPSISITHILISVGLHEPIYYFRNIYMYTYIYNNKGISNLYT